MKYADAEYADTICEIIVGRLYHNIDILAEIAGGRDKVTAVLKANAYGHGEFSECTSWSSGAEAPLFHILREAVRGAADVGCGGQRCGPMGAGAEPGLVVMWEGGSRGSELVLV